MRQSRRYMYAMAILLVILGILLGSAAVTAIFLYLTDHHH